MLARKPELFCLMLLLFFVSHIALSIKVHFKIYIKLITFEYPEKNALIDFSCLDGHHIVKGINLVSCNAFTTTQLYQTKINK